MELGHLVSIGLCPSPTSGFVLTRLGQSSVRGQQLTLTNSLTQRGIARASAEQPRRRFFVIKSKTCDNISLSQTQGKWAFRAHSSCLEGEQPHERLSHARLASSVVLLFFENSEHAWIGHATLGDASQYEPEAEYPHVVQIAWTTCLPAAQGVSFRDVPEARNAHKIFNADEVEAEVGVALCAAIDTKMRAVKTQEELAQSALLDAAFLRIVPDESIEDTNRRLLHEVEVRLGPVVIACACGSRRYNLHFPDSDFDTLVVFAARDPQGVAPIRKNPPGFHPDYTLVEVGHFVEMLNEGDARMIESLYLHLLPEAASPSHGTPDAPGSESAVLQSGAPWRSLLMHRDKLLSRALVRKYLGDATGRAGLTALRKGTKQNKRAKMLYVAFRALKSALRACLCQHLEVWRPSGSPEHTFIMSIREGEATQDLLVEAEALAEEVRRALENSSLPEKADPSIGLTWLSEVRNWAARHHSALPE